MGLSVSNSPRRNSNSFRKVVDVFLKQPGLPLAEVLTAESIEEVFRKHRSLFGIGAICGTATVLWAFLGQLLQDQTLDHRTWLSNKELHRDHNVISFTSTVQFVLQEWKQLSKGNLSAETITAFIEKMLEGIVNCRVADRPGRIEPRVVKRRPKPCKKMTKPRQQLRRELINP